MENNIICLLIPYAPIESTNNGHPLANVVRNSVAIMDAPYCNTDTV